MEVNMGTGCTENNWREVFTCAGEIQGSHITLVCLCLISLEPIQCQVVSKRNRNIIKLTM